MPSAVWVLLVLAYAGLSSRWVSHDAGWYLGLAKPSFQPPDWVFGTIWPLNFLALLVVGVWFPRNVSPGSAWTGVAVLALSVTAALTWAWLFYVPHRLGLASLGLAAACLLTWVLVGLVARQVPWAGLLLVPYAAWVTVATALSVQYVRLN